MRALGAAYDAIIAGRPTRPCWRVRLANHGGGFPDPLDITDKLELFDVERPLRSGNAASIRLNNETGLFDPANGLYALAVQPRNAEVQIDLGETEAGVLTYHRVMTGEIHAAMPNYAGTVAMLDLEVLDRGLNVWQHPITSPEYVIAGATPVYYTAHEIIEDLFTRFAGFTAADFDLDPASDWQLDRSIQFEQEAIAMAAAKVLQAAGYRMWFNYMGQVTSSLLIPTGAPATWAVAGTILEENVAQIDGPSAQPPTATRIQAVGGRYPWPMWNIGEATLWATCRWAWSGGSNPADWNGAIRLVETGGTRGQVTLHIWGPEDEGRFYRTPCSYLVITYEIGGPGSFVIPPAIVPASEYYHDEWQRQLLDIYFQQTIGQDVMMQVEVWGYPCVQVNNQVFVQNWSEALEARWGERRMVIDSPLIYTWTQGQTVTQQEMTIAELSVFQATVALKRHDLRIEPGDVWTVENSKGGNIKLWVKTVTHAVAVQAGQARTQIEGYVIT